MRPGAKTMIVGLLGAAGFLSVIVAAVVAYSGPLALFGNKEGFATSGLQNVLTGGLFVVWIAVFGLFVFTLQDVQADYDAFITQKKAESSPPDAVGVSGTAQQKMRDAYAARGFAKLGQLEQAEGTPELWAGPSAPDETNIFRKPGVLIYADGSATQFNIAVIYGHDAWAIGDWRRVDRISRGKPVKIETAVKRQLVRELVRSNDYVLSVGLASSAPTREDERNEKLAHARAWNAGVAILKLKVIGADRIVGVSLGHATSAPKSPMLESRQRAVVLVGINASRQVSILDVIDGTARIVRVDGVDLTKYSTTVKFPELPVDADYRSPEGMNASPNSEDGWILPAIERSK